MMSIPGILNSAELPMRTPPSNSMVNPERRAKRYINYKESNGVSLFTSYDNRLTDMRAEVSEEENDDDDDATEEEESSSEDTYVSGKSAKALYSLRTRCRMYSFEPKYLDQERRGVGGHAKGR